MDVILKESHHQVPTSVGKPPTEDTHYFISILCRGCVLVQHHSFLFQLQVLLSSPSKETAFFISLFVYLVSKRYIYREMLWGTIICLELKKIKSVSPDTCEIQISVLWFNLTFTFLLCAKMYFSYVYKSIETSKRRTGWGQWPWRKQLAIIWFNPE